MSKSFDDKLRDALKDDFDGLVEELRKAMTSTVRIKTEGCNNIKCSCKHINYVEVPNFKEKRELADWWFNRTEGRAAQKQGEEDSEKIVFERIVYMESPDGEQSSSP